MIKECRVVLRNNHVMVVIFGGKEVQLPSDNNTVSNVFVKCENNKYSLVDRSEYDKSLKKSKYVKTKETELVDEVVDNSVDVNTDEK